MLHTKLIGRIALALFIVAFCGVNLTTNAAQQAANQPLISLPDTRSSNLVIPGYAATSVPAADIVVLGNDNAAQSFLKGSANADIARTLALLRKRTKENGTTRIIIGLRIAFTPEGGLTATAAAQQRNEIARVQSAVLEKVPSLKLKLEQIKRFETSPFMALEVNATELEALVSLTEIVSIEGDRLAMPTSGMGVVVPESK